VNRNSQARSEVTKFLENIIKTSRLDLQFDLESENNQSSRLTIRFRGPDVPMLTAADSNLLNAIGHLIVQSCGFIGATVDASSLVLAGIREDNQNHSLVS
jgi:predicted RNA-binding protein Jag